MDSMEIAEFNVEYDGKHIIIMDYASKPHEKIVGNTVTILNILFRTNADVDVIPSSHPVYREEWGERSYNPDVQVVVGESVDVEHRPGMTAVTNPAVIFEVLSPSTRDKDWSEKLPRYKKMPSVKHIVYLEQDRPFVTVFTRIGDTDKWINVDYDNLEQSFEVLGKTVPLKELYLKVNFNE